ncbi:PREDICTED: DNA polymerase epsilon subunit 4-like [Amphimedon queenslandica]|uniref:Transcription factor CBF/NF-Y/archaeal histone domain-containing protein n=1 Tax=Amphimedon queenslandica TaxID=400682 RepID=A0A1X7VNR4_AMPQE|nr:PREDICTED: DNA polymerase epsilon subunit 4-like [Amphimedon queenslandica]|eukprot:XP_003383552.1 PREDICTED: DNA polymerase epsilon subunit 4-like [Amphimedon queenslandica]
MEESMEPDEHLEVDPSDIASDNNNDNNGLEVNSEPTNNSSILEANLEEGSAENQQDNASYISKSKVSLPLSKVKSIIKSDPDVAMTGSEAVYLMTKMTEMFIGHIANKAHYYTKLGKRKTVQDRDIIACVTNNDELAFLEGILETEAK